MFYFFMSILYCKKPFQEKAKNVLFSDNYSFVE